MRPPMTIINPEDLTPSSINTSTVVYWKMWDFPSSFIKGNMHSVFVCQILRVFFVRHLFLFYPINKHLMENRLLENFWSWRSTMKFYVDHSTMRSDSGEMSQDKAPSINLCCGTVSLSFPVRFASQNSTWSLCHANTSKHAVVLAVFQIFCNNFSLSVGIDTCSDPKTHPFGIVRK